MVPISIKDLLTCFASIEFCLTAADRDVVTVSHPRFREDGHRIGLTFRRVDFPSGRKTWELVSDLKIIQEYAS